MKITVSRSLLSDALRKVQGLASGKNSLPILSNVKIEAHEQKAKFTTTDLDLSVVMEITCNVIAEGAVTLPARLLSDAIARSAEGDVSLEANEQTNKATIRAGSSVFNISGLPAADFPVLPEDDSDVAEFALPQEVLKSLFRRTAYAMSQDDTRRILKGIHFKFADGFLTCAATDGRRLSIAEYHPDEAYPFAMEFTLPAKSIVEMTRNLGNSGSISFKKCVSQITATLDGGVVIYSKLFDDAYPNFMQVIPKDNQNEVLVDRAAFVSAIERVGVFSEEYSMKFAFTEGQCNLQCSTEAGKGEESVPVKYSGTPINATFNHSYILEVLKAIDDDEVTMAFSDGTRPVVIKCSAPGLAIVMPLRIA